MDTTINQEATIPVQTLGAVSPANLKKSILPWCLIIMGTLALIIPLAILWILLPPIVTLISSLGGGSIGLVIALPLAGILGFFIGQIFYGISLVRKQIKAGGIDAIQIKWAIILLVGGVIVAFLFIPAFLISIMNPLYGIIESIK